MFWYLMLTEAELLTNSGVMLAFAFAVSIISLSFMAGEFFTMPTLKGFARAELHELGVSAVILLLLFMFILPNGPFDLVSRGFMVSPAGGQQPALCEEWTALHGPILFNAATGDWYAQNGNIAFGQANYFLGCKLSLVVDWNPFDGVPANGLNGVMTSRLAKGYFSLMLTQMFTGLLAGFSSGLSIPLFKVLTIDIGLTPWVALGPLNQAHTSIVDLIGTTFAAFTAQNMLLKFIEKSALAVFLPFGLMLRAFPFSRKTGSTVIAVVVACYFIFPISILLDQQIWMLIVDPPGEPGCLGVATSCTADKDCCSYDCRNGVCAVPLTEFAEYRSIYSLCEGNPSQAQINETLETIADEQDKRTLELYFTGNPAVVNATKAEGRLNDGLGSIAKQHAGSAWQFTKALLNPSPMRTAQVVFSEIEVLVMDAGQYALLAMLFVVVSIVVSLTMLKDIAILIGGEPRIFGLSKLV